MALDRARVKALFFDVTELPSREREAFLRERTLGEPELHAAVSELLVFHDDAPLIVEASSPAAEDASTSDPLGLVGARLEDRYVVERYVAEGGFAFVYRALDTTLGEPVAIKLFKEVEVAERDRLEAAFRREGELLERLSAAVPTLVRTRGLGRCAGPRGLTLLYLVLEWLDGDVLRVEPGGLPLAEVVTRLTPIAMALAAAHDAGVAHRDVKPGNLFVTRGGTIRLLDFGIAKVESDRERGFASTATARSAFTMNYAAPEQLLNRPTGPWTDVYALAIVCVELLAGRHPYAELGPLEVMLTLPDPNRRPTPLAMGVHVSSEIEREFAAALSVATETRPDMRAFWDSLVAAGTG